MLTMYGREHGAHSAVLVSGYQHRTHDRLTYGWSGDQDAGKSLSGMPMFSVALAGWYSFPPPSVRYPCCLKYCGSVTQSAPTPFSRKWSRNSHTCED